MNPICPCHSGKTYDECCKPYHEGSFPPTALALMRSRYSAYAVGLSGYIMQTTHPRNPSALLPKDKWKNEILEFSKNTEFLGLTILEVIEGERESFVTFRASLKQQGKDASFTEKSRFEKADGKWLYVDGVVSKTA